MLLHLVICKLLTEMHLRFI